MNFPRRYDFISIPIAHPRHQRDFTDSQQKGRFAAFTRADVILNSSGTNCKTNSWKDQILNIQFRLQIGIVWLSESCRRTSISTTKTKMFANAVKKHWNRSCRLPVTSVCPPSWSRWGRRTSTSPEFCTTKSYCAPKTRFVCKYKVLIFTFRR